MSIDSEIRTAMRQVADGAEPPAVDAVSFDRRVRRHRNRRRASIAVATAAVAAVALAVPVTVGQVSSEPGAAPPSVAGATSPQRPPAYFVRGDRAAMLDAGGRLHDLGVRVKNVVGPTAEGVLALSEHDRLVHLRVVSGAGGPAVERIKPPTTQPVSSAAVSADGSRVAVVDAQNDVVVYDLATGDELGRAVHNRPTFVADFSDRVLYAGNGSLRLGVGPDGVEIPVAPDGRAWLSSVGANTVAVTSEESNVTTRLYDVASGSAVEAAKLTGWWGAVSPDGRYFLGAQDEGARELRDLETQASYPVSGLEGDAAQLTWLDGDTALVASQGVERAGQTVSLLFACEAATRACEEIHESVRNIRLGG